MEAATDRAQLMFIHGAWLAANSWDTFAEYFESRGYAVSAPEWPRKRATSRSSGTTPRRSGASG